MAVFSGDDLGDEQEIAVPIWEWWVGWLVFATSIVVMIVTFYTAFDLRTPLPYLDQWEVVRDIAAWHDGSWDWSTLWRQHQEHRPVFPRLVMYADFAFFEGRNLLNTYMLLILQVTQVVLLTLSSWWYLRRVGFPRSVQLCVLSAVVAMGFSIVQIENYIHGFQIVAMLGSAAAIAALFSISRQPAVADHLRKDLPGILACLFAVIAQFSFANGVLVWPVMLALGWVKGVPIRHRVLIVAAGTAATVAHYTMDYESVAGRSQLGGFENPLRLGQFFFVEMGGPFVPLLGYIVSGGIGILGLILFGFALFKLRWRRPNRASSEQLFLLGVCAFAILTAAAIAVGRADLGLDWASTPRYSQEPVLFWAAMLPISVVRIARVRPDWDALVRLPAVGLSAVFAIVAVGTPFSVLPPWQKLFDSFDGAQDSLQMGVYDRGQIRVLYPPDVDSIFPLVPVLEAHGYSVFAGDNPSQLLGQPLDRLSTTRDDSCIGSFDAIDGVDGPTQGVYASGWAWDAARHRRVDKVVVVGDNNVIVGVATRAVERPDVKAARLEVTRTDAGWGGYARRRDGDLKAYAVLPHNVLCQLPGVQREPPIRGG